MSISPYTHTAAGEQEGFSGFLRTLHLDALLLLGLIAISVLGLVVLYSASNGNMELVMRQLMRLGFGFLVMFIAAQIPPATLHGWTPWVYFAGICLLVAVLVFGEIGKGAQRWLDIGVVRFQPSEILKLAVPMMVAWFLADKPLPPERLRLVAVGLIILTPTLLIAKQPDLGTALLVGASGAVAIFLSGLRLRIIFSLIALGAASVPLLWSQMHAYQRQRVLTFLDPEKDPLGAGYHIIQSKIAIGSGGLYGKGWLNGTQSQLDFIPERSTDFIFAVFGEEFGLFGTLLLLAIYLLIVIRCFYIATQGQETYTRLLGGAIGFTFFIYVFVNIGMVSGLLPVVGVPLPLVSYGGTSMVTLMAGFGVLMSIQTHRRLLAF